MLKEFREFAMRGNVIDMAVGIIIGAAFGSIINSLVNDIIMPPVGLLLGNVDFSNLFITLKPGEIPGPYTTITAAQEAGAVTWNYGMFINTVITFLIVAFAVFLLIRNINRLQRQEKVTEEVSKTRPCPYCTLEVSLEASRCPYCTSSLES